MPAFIKTDKDEERWAKAKEIARQEYDVGEDSPKFYAVVTGIYKKMKGGSVGKSHALFLRKSTPHSASLARLNGQLVAVVWKTPKHI